MSTSSEGDTAIGLLCVQGCKSLFWGWRVKYERRPCPLVSPHAKNSFTRKSSLAPQPFVMHQDLTPWNLWAVGSTCLPTQLVSGTPWMEKEKKNKKTTCHSSSTIKKARRRKHYGSYYFTSYDKRHVYSWKHVSHIDIRFVLVTDTVFRSIVLRVCV